ncbi:hypothetical protein SAMN05216296_3208 [Pseudomonas pohangensis]|uniref:Uncharacterized protein n=1 Tax=Pseudomonas pohangensis TaxID=364197 RepID=A0A1H2HRG8_9PSED|nr:hypothetical protein [Pseudomonas pohangensis]SDU34395.1 hypothetical protein SAMN05216296_3208 [Pseudomonas pohangensis]
MKVLKSGLASLLFLVLLLGVYWFHVRYLRVDVVFYAAIADVFIAAILAALILFGIRYFALFTGFEKTLLVVIWLLAGYALAISVPTVIDRSLSFYILEKLQQRGGGIRHERFEEVFTKEYVKEHRLVDVRLTEQLESGTIAIENGCVKLTEKGGAIASFGRYFRANWLPKKRLLMGFYSDDLTDPFRKSAESMDYKCR